MLRPPSSRALPSATRSSRPYASTGSGRPWLRGPALSPLPLPLRLRLRLLLLLLLRLPLPLLLLLPLLLTSCINYHDVTFHGVKSVQVLPAEGSELAFRIDAEVENPNGYRIRLKKPDVDLWYNGQHIGKGRLDSTVVLDKHCSKVYPVYVRADTEGKLGPMLLGGLGTLFSGKVEVEAKGTVLGQVGIFSKRFPFHVKEDLNQH